MTRVPRQVAVLVALVVLGVGLLSTPAPIARASAVRATSSTAHASTLAIGGELAGPRGRVSAVRLTTGVGIPARQAAAIAGAGCPLHATYAKHTLGFTVYLNHCLVVRIMQAADTASVIASIVALACAPCRPVSRVLGIFLQAARTWLEIDDTACGNRGVKVEDSWLVAIHLSKVC